MTDFVRSPSIYARSPEKRLSVAGKDVCLCFSRGLECPSFLVFPTEDGCSSVLELVFEELVDCEGDGLAGRNSHDAGCDAFVESVKAFLSVSRS